MISLITWQHLNVYSYKLKNNVCVISIFFLYEAKNWLVKSYCGRWSKKLTSGPVHMRSFLWWMRLLRIRSTGLATCLIRVSHSCFHTLLIWRNPTFLWNGVSMGVIHHRHMVTTDASLTGWGALFEGRPAHGVWTGEFLSWHIHCLELRAVFLGLIHFLPFLRGCHVIVRTDNMAVVSYINR